MSLVPAITNIEELKDRPQVDKLLAWNSGALESAKFDRDELTVWIKPSFIRDALEFLRDDSDLKLNYLSDITCVDWYPNEPRFEVVYHLLSLPNKADASKRRLRLKVRLDAVDTRIDSATPVFPNANYYEREVFDLFGIHFEGHPYLRRIMMPDDWEGHPLRKDYPVEGYR